VDDHLWLGPSPRFWQMRASEVAVGSLVALIVAVAASSRASTAVIVAVIAAVLAACGAVLFFVRNRFRSWGYFERDEDLLVKRGVMFRRLSVVPYGRMQFVEVTAGLVERMFSLSTVKLHTAAARSDARIPGLDPAEAQRLRDQLAALGEAKAAGL
jgi:uncharacterized protein